MSPGWRRSWFLSIHLASMLKSWGNYLIIVSIPTLFPPSEILLYSASSFNKYLLSDYCVLGTIFGNKDV